MEDKQEESAVAELSAYHSRRGTGVTVVDTEGLVSTQERRSLPSYIREVWSFRHFTLLQSRYKALGDNDEMFLGRLWVVLEPLLRIAMYGIIFGLVLQTSRGIDNFIGFLVLGLLYFQMLSRGLGSGSGLLQRSRAMMRTFNFPKASLVLGEGIRALLSSIIPGILAVIAALLFQWGSPISWTIVLVVPLFILIQVFALGLMFITARITAFVPDAKKIIFFINRAWFYISGVFFSVERYANVPVLQEIMQQNPAYRFLTAIRDAVMYGESPSMTDALILLSWAAGTLIVGFLFFWKAEDRYVLLR